MDFLPPPTYATDVEKTRGDFNQQFDTLRRWTFSHRSLEVLMPEDKPTFDRQVGTIVRSSFHKLKFFVVNQMDSIQRFHFIGQFYEAEDLELAAKFTKPGMIYLDIGSNVGNHAIYFAVVLGAKQVIVFEPNPAAYEILLVNVALNRLTNIDLEHLGKALADHQGSGQIVTRHENNLGLGVLKEGEGDVHVVAGDSVIGDSLVDFIKIDVEGLEMAVLSGLNNCIRTNRPIIFIEVDQRNDRAFESWCESNRYRIAERFRRYPVNENFIIIPI